jgi:hypothetical protein
MNGRLKAIGVAAALIGAAACTQAQAQQAGASKKMSFFVTSTGSGNGANLGGLAGADKICQARADSVGAGKRNWRAYLSTSAATGQPGVNARDRIGRGPWYNAKGIKIAQDVDDLHVDNKLTKQTALNEKGEVINGVGDKPNRHDILTGSDTQGRAHPTSADTTCGNWTKSGAGAAQVGHSDRTGLTDTPPAHSWNMSHLSRGCSQENLRSSGGDGLLYCFASK